MFGRRKLTEDDELTLEDALDPKVNPFTFGEWHYFVTGFGAGFVAGLVLGPILVYIISKAIGG